MTVHLKVNRKKKKKQKISTTLTRGEKMLDEDDITPSEAGFMMGREQEPRKDNSKNAISHTDETSVELAKEDAEDS